MDFSSQQKREASVHRKQAFAERWAIDDESDAISSDSNASILHEPCILQDTCASLPIELFSLNLEDLTSTVFCMDVWKNLDSKSKEYLKTFLPARGEKTPSADLCVEKLFSGENIKFGNPVQQFASDLLAGEYNAEVQKYKQQVERMAQQQRLLAMKIYHNKMIKHALEYKRKLGLKVDEGVMDFYRSQPEDIDLQEKRRLERAQAAMTKQLIQRKRDKQLSSLFLAATTIAAKQDVERADPSQAHYKLTHALADIGVQLPTRLQIGLPDYTDDVYYSEDEEASSDTASHVSEGNEAELDELIDDLENGTSEKRKNIKKRKRDEIDGTAMEDKTDEIETTTVAPVEKKKMSADAIRRAAKKLLPPLPYEETFSLFPTIRNYLLITKAPSGSTATLSELQDCIKSIPKLVEQIPHCITLEKMLSLAIHVLLMNPNAIPGYTFSLRKANTSSLPSMQKEVETSIATSASIGGSGAFNPAAMIPFLKVAPGNDFSGTFSSTSKNVLYAWNLPAGHPQHEILEKIEALFFFALSRGHLTADGKNIDFEQSKAAKASLTLSAPTEAGLAEYRAQESRRYDTPDMPFTFTTSQPLPGHSPRCVAAPNVRVTGGRKGSTLRADKPDQVNTSSIVRDALARLPGGVGTRADVASLILYSQYLLPEITDASQLGNFVTGTLDRIHYEYDTPVRYDIDLRLYIYLHRQRTPEDFLRYKQFEEKVKNGDTAELWTALSDTLEANAAPFTATNALTGFIEANLPV